MAVSKRAGGWHMGTVILPVLWGNNRQRRSYDCWDTPHRDFDDWRSIDYWATARESQYSDSSSGDLRLLGYCHCNLCPQHAVDQWESFRNGLPVCCAYFNVVRRSFCPLDTAHEALAHVESGAEHVVYHLDCFPVWN